ncbi:MAG: hypothetical protein PUP93_11500 [Rhizonema sp. NSF051]|nr:hypothetical protein [Rhizonema sp. NSF051]
MRRLPPIGLSRISWKLKKRTLTIIVHVLPPIGLSRISWKRSDNKIVCLFLTKLPPIGLSWISWKLTETCDRAPNGQGLPPIGLSRISWKLLAFNSPERIFEVFLPIELSCNTVQLRLCGVKD